MKRKLVLRNRQAPGDHLVLSACIRAIDDAYPGRFDIYAQTADQDIWANSPRVLPPPFPREHVFDIGYTAGIQGANAHAGHFVSGMLHDVATKLRLDLPLRDLRPEVWLTEEEKDPANSPVPPGYWVVMAGGKFDFTPKIWDKAFYQRVVDSLRGDVRFVQCGKVQPGHAHPPLSGVESLVGKTTLRAFLRTIYHSAGVVCPVTAAMHAAAAFNKPCVVVAGGREPWWWEAYTRKNWEANCAAPCPSGFVPHRFIHSVGKLGCCRTGGCWAAALGDEKPVRSRRRCSDVVDGPTIRQPRCMAEISPEAVAGAVRDYLRGVPVPEDDLPAGLAPPLLTACAR